MDIEKSGIDTIEIKDISVLSYLYATGEVNIVGKRKNQNGDVYFQIAPKNTAQELILQYWNQTAKPIQPKRLFSALRDMKDLIFGG